MHVYYFVVRVKKACKCNQYHDGEGKSGSMNEGQRAAGREKKHSGVMLGVMRQDESAYQMTAGG